MPMRSVTHNALVVILTSLRFLRCFELFSSPLRSSTCCFPFVIFFQYVLLFSTHSVNSKSVHIVHPHFIRLFFPLSFLFCSFGEEASTNSFPTNNFSFSYIYTAATLRIGFLTYESVAYSDRFSNRFRFKRKSTAMWQLFFKANIFPRPTAGKNNE